MKKLLLFIALLSFALTGAAQATRQVQGSPAPTSKEHRKAPRELLSFPTSILKTSMLGQAMVTTKPLLP